MTDQPPDHADAEKSATILICEDDPDTRMLLKQLVEAEGHQTVEAENGQVAIDYCKQQLPDLIVLDLMMPLVTGNEFIEWFRAEQWDRFVPVLMLTALSEVDDRVEGLARGADDYLTKPFNGRELLARMQALLRIGVLMQQLRTANAKMAEMQQALVESERQLVAAQMGGAAAHKLRQPVTSVMLNCHLISAALEGAEGKAAADARGAINAIRKECEFMNEALEQMAVADAGKTKEYVGDMKIIDFETPTTKKKP